MILSSCLYLNFFLNIPAASKLVYTHDPHRCCIDFAMEHLLQSALPVVPGSLPSESPQNALLWAWAGVHPCAGSSEQALFSPPILIASVEWRATSWPYLSAFYFFNVKYFEWKILVMKRKIYFFSRVSQHFSWMCQFT